MARSSTGLAALAARVVLTPTGTNLLRRRAVARVRGHLRSGRVRAAEDEARRRLLFLSQRGRASKALGLARECVTLMGVSDPTSAVLRLEAAIISMDHGAGVVAGAGSLPESQTASALASPITSVTDLHDAVIDALTLADAAWAMGQDERVEDLLDLVLRAMFHRSLHFSSAPSALTSDPEAFLAPLRASTAWRAVTGVGAPRQSILPTSVTSTSPGVPGGVSGEHGDGDTEPSDVDPSAHTSAPEPHRVLVISLRNWTFIQGIIDDYRADPGYEVRTRDLVELPHVPHQRSILGARIAQARARLVTSAPSAEGSPVGAQADTSDLPDQRPVDLGAMLHDLPDSLLTDLAWAQTIIVEWGHRAAAWASLVAPVLAPQARLVIRLHSYEASTAMPQLINWASVDELITVSPAIAQIVRASVALPSSLTQTTVPNRGLLIDYQLPKVQGSERTIALVGWAALRKDPAWALDVLDLLRARDPAWRLLLIGPDFPADLPPGERSYAEGVHRRLAELGQAVSITGQTSEVCQHLRRAAVILSASRREGTHEGFIQGAASGALPVCRSWPDVEAWGGARALFPLGWVVETPEQAVARILSLADDASYRQAQATWTLDHFDWSHVRPLYDRILMGSPIPKE